MKKRVVVTGLGVIGPLGNNVAESWEKAKNGISGVARITHFDPEAYSTQIAAEVKGFDPLDHFDKKSIKKMDTFIQYALVASKEALKDAKLEITDEIAPHAGVSIGVGIGGLPNIEHFTRVLDEKGPGRVSPFFIPMTIANMASGLVSIEHNCKGYNTTTTSACSSSNHSIGDAMRIIQNEDAKVMIAGGAEAAVCGLAIAGFGNMKALSKRNDEPEKASRPYDKNRDGFVLGEGAGILILEELEFAKARGAKIYGEVVGYGFSADAYHITTPNTDGPTRAMKMALKEAGLLDQPIDYINAHGTSTPAGDMNELEAVKLALGEHAYTANISSTKSMHGHLLGGAGGIEAVLSMKAMEHSLIPPTINIDEQDEACDLNITPNVAVERELNTIMSNSFGFGGTNATLVFKKLK